MRKVLMLLITLLMVTSAPTSVKAAPIQSETAHGACGPVLVERLPILQPGVNHHTTSTTGSI